MRTFTLVNGNNESCDITDRSLFFHDPTGLGFERDTKFRQVGERFVVINKKPKQKSIGGKVALIGEDPYLTYFNFIQFLSQEPLTLFYTPNNAAASGSASGVTYRRKVVVKKVDKTEMEHAGYLDCSIEMVPLEPWYRYKAISNGDIDQSELLRWGVTWGIDWGPLDDFSLGIVSDGAPNSPSRITIYGPVTNPSWRHYVNGQLIEEGKLLDTSVGSSEYILIDNTRDPYTIALYSTVDDSFISDLYDKSDFTTARFINIQNGRNTFAVSDDGAVEPIMKVEAFIYYESV